MSDFATISDIIALWRPLTQAETERATALLPVVSDMIRFEGSKYGYDVDAMVEESANYANVVKMVTVDVVGRILRTPVTGEPMTQESQSALGYVWSGTSAVPGGGISNALMRNDLKRLGFKRQKYGCLDPYGVEAADETN